MSGITRRWTARIAGVAATATLVVGGTTGTSFAIENPPNVNLTANFAVVASTHPDTTGCNGYKVTGTGTATGNPSAGVWSQTEDACTATIPGKYEIKGTAMITEPDGDKFKISYHLTAPLTGDTMVYPTGTFSILRGEGTYEDATGSGTMKATVNLLDHDHVTANLSGYLRFYWQI
ncbi:hypothetical protein [Streptomyces exfoliatus]|uniref:hypothetical protein n=1 Tax=Streptomyces exfoliatus TaxID=1905 RepID=UPI0004CA220A|nr:hypothetical protein [Streptomyces exfoliatus]